MRCERRLSVARPATTIRGIAVRLSPMRQARRARVQKTSIYLVATRDTLGKDWIERVLDALDSGVVGMVQLRANTMSRHDWQQAAGTLRASVPRDRALLVLNDDVELAVALDYDGAHVGQDDMDVPSARRLLGRNRILGLSTHSPDEVRASPTEALDLLGLGPCFPTASKTLTLNPQGAALVSSCLPVQSDVPIFPIGGISSANVSTLIGAGATRVAVGNGILGGTEPKQAARELAAAMVAVR